MFTQVRRHIAPYGHNIVNTQNAICNCMPKTNMHESVTIQDVYEALKQVEAKMVTREDLEALVDSVEILSNPKTMEALRKSEEDIKAGGVKEVTSVDDLLAEL